MSDSLFTPERIAAAHAETERLCRDLDITNADHIALWLEANIGDASLGYLAVRIIEAHEAALSASTDAAPATGSGQGVISDAALDAILADESPADDDAAFVTVWLQLEARGYLWSESNVEKAHVGWQLARALSHPPVGL